MDEVLKDQSQYEAQWMYQFNYNSWNNWLPDYMGKSSSVDFYIYLLPNIVHKLVFINGINKSGLKDLITLKDSIRFVFHE